MKSIYRKFDRVQGSIFCSRGQSFAVRFPYQIPPGVLNLLSLSSPAGSTAESPSGSAYAIENVPIAPVALCSLYKNPPPVNSAQSLRLCTLTIR